MAKCRYNEMTQQMRSVPHQNFQQMNQIQSQAPPHLMSTITQQHQQAPPQSAHINMSTVQQSHMMHNHQNYHQNRSGGQHNHHSQQQRLGYGQNRPNFHNGNHNMHNNHGGNNVANIQSNVAPSTQPQQPQQQIQSQQTGIKHKQQESNITNIQQSNQSRFKQQIDAQSLNNTSNKENVLNMVNDNNNAASKLIIEMNHHGCVDDQNGNSATESTTTSTTHTSKTAMCIINEIVRAHQLKHQYRVIDEIGPSHEKLYTVVLELGDERYTAQSKTIKGAQHTAAAIALEKTNYKIPKPQPRHTTPRYIPRHQRSERSGTAANTVTPTVQLNALAMKIGMPTNYAYQYPESYVPQALNTRNIIDRDGRMKGNKKGRSRDKYNNNRPLQHVLRTTEDDPFRVTVMIGDRKFTGTGLTMQSAKHDAAANALAELRDEPLKILQANSTTTNYDSSDKSVDGNGDVMSENNVDRMKSSISVVQEIAQKRNLPIRFMVENETGPAHMKHFVIKCTVGDIATTGDGNSKKVAKKRAAENMLNELKKLPPPQRSTVRSNRTSKRNVNAAATTATTQNRQQVQNVNSHRKSNSSTASSSNAANQDVLVNTSTISNDTNTSDECEINNPIATLLRIQQTTKQTEPIYTIIEERTQNHRKQFIMEVNYADMTARGVGGNKKIAKREAAKAMLMLLGTNDNNNLIGSTVSTGTAAAAAAAAAATLPTLNEKSRKTKYNDTKANNDTSNGQAINRSLPGGVLFIKSPDNKKSKNSNTSTIAKDLLNVGTSTTNETITKQNSPGKNNNNNNNNKSHTEKVTPIVEVSPTTKVESNNNNVTETKSTAQSNDRGIRPADQLLYLADLLQFKVQFDDFPKGNHSDYLTLASLTTDPPQMFHGYGNSAEASKNQAALAALKALSELGLDNVNKPRDQQQSASILSNGKSN